MVAARVGRLVVVARDAPARALGIITRSDLLRTHEPRLVAAGTRVRIREPMRPWRRRRI